MCASGDRLSEIRGSSPEASPPEELGRSTRPPSMQLAPQSASRLEADEIALLHALMLRGVSSPEGLAQSTGLNLDQVRRALSGIESANLAVHRDGRVSGWTPTTTGREVHSSVLNSDLAPIDRSTALALYERFGEVNTLVKQVCTDWQIRTSSGGMTRANDHYDRAYDGGVIARLSVIHAEVNAMCIKMGSTFPRAERYRRRLTEALTALKAGDRNRFTHPLSESYHDIWMEFHQDLLLSLRLKRTDSDA